MAINTNLKKVLGQNVPAADTWATIYAVPASTQAGVSNLNCCNLGAATTVSVRVRVAGVADNDKQYVVYQLALDANDTEPLQLGITLAATDQVRVKSLSGNVAFNLFGYEEELD